MTGTRRVRIAELAAGDQVLVLVDPAGVPHIPGATRPLEPSDRLDTAEVFLEADDGRLRITHNGRRFAVTYTGNPTLLAIGTHHAVCADCGELYPCRHIRTDQITRRFAAELSHLPEAPR